MDFPCSCRTGVLFVDGFCEVPFRVYATLASTTTTNTASAGIQGRTNSDHPEEVLEIVETALRGDGFLVTQDRTNRQLWIFRPSDAEIQKLQRSSDGMDGKILIADTLLKCLWSGTFRSSDLLQYHISGDGDFPGKLSSTTMDKTPNDADFIHSANALAWQANAFGGGSSRSPNYVSSALSRASPTVTPHDMYALLLASILASVNFLYRLRENTVPLEPRTILSLPTQRLSDGSDFAKGTWDGSIHTCTISIQMTSAGSLIISCSHTRRSPLRSLANFDAAAEATSIKLLSNLVCTAPNGGAAKILEFPTEQRHTRSAQRRRRHDAKRQRTNYLDQNRLHGTKLIALNWLRRKGIDITRFGPRMKWVKLALALSDTDALWPVLFSQSSYLMCCWPAALCFCVPYNQAVRGITSNNFIRGELSVEPQSARDGLQWFQFKNQEGFQNSLLTTQTWLLSTAYRDKRVEDIRLARQKAREAVRKEEVADEITFDFSSPPEMRTGTLNQDIQAISGVYPTPPEGFPSQGSIGAHQSTDSAMTPTGAFGLDQSFDPDAESGNQATGHLGDFNSQMRSQYAALAGTNQTNIDTLDRATDENEPHLSGRDDFFGDIDEDMFEDSRVTDADFNFFDEPDTTDSHLEEGLVPSKLNSPNQAHMANNQSSRTPPVASEPDLKPGNNMATGHQTVPQGFNAPKGDPAGVDLDSEAEHCEKNKHHRLDSTSPDEHEYRGNLSESSFQGGSCRENEMQNMDSSKNNVTPRVGASIEESTLRTRKHSLFGPVDFDARLKLVDVKYGVGGRFGSMSGVKPALKDGDISTLLSMVHQRPTSDSQTDSDSRTPERGTGDNVSDTGSHEILSSLGSHELKEPVKRKTHADYNSADSNEEIEDDGSGADHSTLSDSDIVASETSDDGLYVEESGATDNEAVGRGAIHDLEPNPATMSPWNEAALVQIPHQRGPSNHVGFNISHEQIAHIALILVDQLISSTLFSPDEILRSDTLSWPSMTDDRFEASRAPSATLALREVTKQLFPTAVELDLSGLAKIKDECLNPQGSKLQPRPVPRRANASHGAIGSHDTSIMYIPTSRVRVQRGTLCWDILPSAMSFWDSMGLGPYSGAKNVCAYCIYPFSADIEPNITQFLDDIGAAYENARLGDHQPGQRVGNNHDGLVPVTLMDANTVTDALCALRQTCAQLGLELASTEDPDAPSPVIYLVQPFRVESALKYMCAAFWTLLETYRQTKASLRIPVRRNDPVLQLLPMEFVASFDAPVVPSAEALTKLAREVYDRCPPNPGLAASSALPITVAPAVVLEEVPPRMIPFRLTAEPGTDLLHENSCLHVAYAPTGNEAWITAAWTDNFGKYQATMAYSMTGGRTFEEIAVEIWETTLHILRAWHVHWRLFVVRVGVMPRKEADVWRTLVLSPNQSSCAITLLNVDSNPPLALNVTPGGQTPAMAGPAGAYSTPAPTPQPASTSLDQHGNPPTPLNPATPMSAVDGSFDLPDPKSTLGDVTDDTWGVMLSYRLNNSDSLTDYNPALASAYLVKRGGTDYQDRPVCIAVNVIWCNSSNLFVKTPDGILREVLMMYKALGTLARVRAIEDEKAGILPWHVAAAKKGAAALACYM